MPTASVNETAIAKPGFKRIDGRPYGRSWRNGLSWYLEPEPNNAVLQVKCGRDRSLVDVKRLISIVLAGTPESPLPLTDRRICAIMTLEQATVL